MAGLFMPMVKKMAEKGGFNSLNKSVEACNRRLAAMEVVGEAAGGLVRDVSIAEPTWRRLSPVQP